MLFLPVKLLIRSDETGADVVSQEGSDPFLFQNREARSVLNSSRSYSGSKISSTLLVPMALFGAMDDWGMWTNSGSSPTL